MMKRVIAFEGFSVPHTGGALAKMLRKVFVNFNLKAKILSITLDNASKSTKAIGRLKLKYSLPMKASGASSSRASSGNPMTNLLNRLKEKSNKRARNDRSLSSKYERYVNEDFISRLEPYEFAVAFESAFSTSERVLSIQRTRLTLTSLEMCMCLKDHLDATERLQHTSNVENALEFEEEILDGEVQENEAIALSEEEIVLDAASEARSNRSGSGGEEFDYDLTLSD
nr:zinc finger BED domain-containing protein RICESLEEPER 2 [Tanacetum cinerariifolium]